MKTRLGSPVAYLLDSVHTAYPLGYTPEQVTLGGEGWSWNDNDRQGLKPLSYVASQKLRTMAWSHSVTSGIGGDSMLHNFRHLNNSGGPVRAVNVSPHEAGMWRISDLSINITQRNPSQGMETATVTWSLTEWVNNVLPKIGRSVAFTAPDSRITGAFKYTVKAGETLYTIAAKQLGDASRWQEVAKMNNLTDIHVKPGKVLNMPAPNPGAIGRNPPHVR